MFKKNIHYLLRTKVIYINTYRVWIFGDSYLDPIKNHIDFSYSIRNPANIQHDFRIQN